MIPAMNLPARPRVLIIEDEPSIAASITYAFDTEGFECVACGTAKAGLAALDPPQSTFDLIILDVGLPDANGFEVCKSIRARTATPVIFLTARSSELDRVVGLEIGGDDYVVKPFSPRELTARAKAVLRRTRGSLSHPQTAAGPESVPLPTPFAVDEERRSIRYFGVPLHLSRVEYSLLGVLIRRPGRVFSRDELLEQAWPEPEASLDRTVDAHVKSLRAKLKEIRPDLDPIRTHRGVGYALSEGPWTSAELI
jgi:two-component system catabolic regulation response regulator CreB